MFKKGGFSRGHFNPRAAFIALIFSMSVLISGVNTAKAQTVNEGFESLSALLSTGGWFDFNHSDPADPSSPGWFQCTGTQIAPAQGGTTNSCVSANFGSGTGVATLNDWLLGPTRTFHNGDMISFYTRTITGNPYPDRMQVRLSTNGSSTNIGTTADVGDVGDFTMLLLDINPTYQVGGYPETWTQYVLTLSGLPTSGATSGASGRFGFRYFVENGGPTGANSYIIGIDSLVYTPNAAQSPTQHVLDFNGDGKTDYSVIRNTGGTNGQLTWYNRFVGGTDPCVSGPSRCVPWGLASDTAVPADYDGDHITDIAVWRSGAPMVASFYVLRSMDSTVLRVPFGQTGDDPTVTRDYTGDGKADPAIFRPTASGTCPGSALWSYLASSGPPATNGLEVDTCFGRTTDIPAPGDYNGDGKADFAVQRAANNGSGQAVFYAHYGSGTSDVQTANTYAPPVTFGLPTDFIVTGDYDGDGKTDVAVTRPINGQWNWFIHPSGGGADINQIWGLSTDYQVQGDYDGDGKTDIAVFRNGTFHVLGTTSGYSPFPWGQSGDYPAANYDTH